MSSNTIRIWSFIHKWSSLVCTLFLLMLCVTGLPLIFHDEIEHALDSGETWQPANPDGPMLTLDEVLDAALANRPGEVPLFMSFDEDRPVVNVTTGPTPDAPGNQMYFERFDRTSGEIVPAPTGDGGVMDFILQLHTDMFLGLPGMLFLGAMGVLFVAALVSGVVLYAPFMRKLRFGTLRFNRSSRVKWLDYHNLLGIVALLWMSVVGVTGVMNTLADPLLEIWQADSLADLTTEFGDAPVAQNLSSVQAAVERASAEAPGAWVQFVAFPGGGWSTDYHLSVFIRGDTPATSHMVTPVLIEAETGNFAAMREMPWYMKALAFSGPLHFGDYGGLPLKIIWFVLDLFTIIILVTGIYLWLAKAKRNAPTSSGLAMEPAE
ncbi:PepSY domain-containing protein [Ponticaulis sp.]|uniref:PepSY-associated TM helix domain-containing protein n=1 Tax=Ponticaulis sp. TaxID=2020902 RepID=UPI000B6E6285|nr:PepSY domain-containing protein [Ponticaulis sp.]MAI91434.1 peptidase [Ponticaulis sp.]OUX97791.1 MAG: peptidase [Hyphomonadaceae bacterium TMED5]